MNSTPHRVDRDVAMTTPAPGTAAVVGLGYVGLPSALALADAGTIVRGVDVSETQLVAIKAERVDLPPDDRHRLARLLTDGGLVLTTETSATTDVDLVLVCVPTPVDEHRVPDLRALSAACASVVDTARAGQVIVLSSTTYVGCTRDLLVTPLAQRGLRVGVDVFVAFSPERIDPGVTQHVPRDTPRVVGGVTEECGRRARTALRSLAQCLHSVSSPETAEMAKLLENSFRAVNIALANEIADAGRELGLDPSEVVEAAATKPFGFMLFRPGPGVGGHCIPCDPHYLLWQLRARRTSAPLLDQAMTAIAYRPNRVVHRAREVLAERGRALAGATVLVVGVAYKPGVADVRESPALDVLADILACGARAAYTDPHVPEVTLSGITLTSEEHPGDRDWNLVVVHTAHPDADLGWISRQHAVLDATYRLAPTPNRHVL